VLRIGLRSRELRASWWMALLTLAGVLLFVQLGRWQLHRAAEKRVLQAAFDAGALQISDLGARALAAVPRYQQVRFRGHYEPEHQFLLDNMTDEGRIGYQVLSPFRLEDQRLVLVNRGWVPLPEGSRRTLPDIAVDAGQVRQLVGRVDELPVTGIAVGRAPPEAGASWPKRTSFPATADLSAALAEPIESRQILLGAAEPDGFVRHWKSASAQFPALRHIGYAIQWWGFAALALVLFIILNLKPRTLP
jgi:surfeit locus 1 family protein